MQIIWNLNSVGFDSALEGCLETCFSKIQPLDYICFKTGALAFPQMIAFFFVLWARALKRSHAWIIWFYASLRWGHSQRVTSNHVCAGAQDHYNTARLIIPPMHQPPYMLSFWDCLLNRDSMFVCLLTGLSAQYLFTALIIKSSQQRSGKFTSF